jgi:bifunctional DNase/RNase
VKQVDVMGVRVEMPTNKPILLLRERGGERYVPIWIGAPEATAIAYAQQGVTPPRPLTHDLLLDILTGLGHELSSVMITRMEEGVFYAELVIDGDRRISARSSDAVAVALRAKVPVFVDDDVLAEVGVDVPVEEEDEVERFREFLDNVSAEDFEVDDEGSDGHEA